MTASARKWAMAISLALASAANVDYAEAASAKAAAPQKQQPAASQQLSIATVNNAAPSPSQRGTLSRPVLLRAQVLLDRARYSSGEIDAASGSNLKKAVVAYQKQNQLEPTGAIDAATWTALTRDTEPALVEYTLGAADVAGPFVKIPSNMADKAQLPALGYASATEGLGEKFHISPKLLQQLNPRKNLGREGEVIVVPNVGTAPPLQKMEKGGKIVVSKSQLTITLLDPSGAVVAHFPASAGSEHDPLPIGNWKINGVSRNPKFHYNPKLFWDAEPGDKKATIPPGPNNPVGVVWIDLSKEHYGIHGTPEPSKIGKTQSHGCIRMTNWDAAALAQAVHPGMVAVLTE